MYRAVIKTSKNWAEKCLSYIITVLAETDYCIASVLPCGVRLTVPIVAESSV